MLSLLAPGALVALAALAVPPLIHLRRRSEQRLVRFAALRWLGRGVRPRRRLRLERPWLLALRLCLVATLAVLLARPVWHAAAAPSPPWVVVLPGLDAAAARAAVGELPAEWHWLAPAFPPLASAAPPPAGAGFASLLRQLDAQLPPGAALYVVVPQELAGLDAERLQLRRPAQWRVLPGGGTSQPQSLPTAGGGLSLALRYDAQHAGSLQVVQALASAWRSSGLAVTLDQEQSSQPPDSAVDDLFWLGGDPPQALRQWARSGGTLIAAAAGDAAGDDAALPSPLPLGRGRLLLFAAPLDAATNPALRNPELPTRLLALLRRGATLPDRAPAASVIPVAALASTPENGSVTPLDAWAALLVALLFLAERSWSLRARAEPA